MTEKTPIHTPVQPDADPQAAVKAFMSQLDACNQQEAARIIRRVSQTKGKPCQKDLENMASWLDRGLDKVRQRQAAHKPASFPAGLPVSDRVDDISKAIEEHQVVIIAVKPGRVKPLRFRKSA